MTNFSYEDGYQMTSNYDEYGNEVARSLFYQVDNKIVIDTFDNKKHYRCVQGDTGWETTSELHGFSRNPFLIKRGKVAWEYAESSIEMWELMANIAAIALKRFGTFALAFWGEMDKGSLQRDSSTLIVNLSSDTTNGKQDVKGRLPQDSGRKDFTVLFHVVYYAERHNGNKQRRKRYRPCNV